MPPKSTMIIMVALVVMAGLYYLRHSALQRTEISAIGSLGNSVRTDSESIERGKIIFDSKCDFCHDAFSTETMVGPGLKGVTKNAKLPASRYPATPENIIRQLRQPFSKMPSFDYLTNEEVEDLVAFLNTL